MSPRPPARRLRGLLAVLVLGFSGIATRVVVLQVRDADEYLALAHEQRVRQVALPAARGSIFDRNGHELAISVDAKAVYANPPLIERPGPTAVAVAEVLEAPTRKIRRALRTDDAFVYLARRVGLERAAELEELGLDGIGFLDETKRFYPSEDLAAQTLGFVGLDGEGLAGVELQYDDVLAGRPGKLVVEQDPTGRPIPQGTRRIRDPEPGRSLVLTIDRDLQWKTQRALEEAVDQNDAKGGTVVVLDPRTGDVLAMATYPWFDANSFQDVPAGQVRNRAITDVYEPGSVNKVITAAAALHTGVIGGQQQIAVPGAYQVGDKLFTDVQAHGTIPMTLSDIITRSSNIGTIKVAELLGQARLSRWLTRFGYGEPTGIDFPGEAKGILPPREDWWSTSMGTIPMGQGIAVTPLQMASVYATIANDGVRLTPRLVRGTIGTGGGFDPLPVEDGARVVSRGAAAAVRDMLVRVVEEGTGTAARVPGYRVGGKTGTARKPLEDALGYSDRYMASFVGLAPAEDPAIVVAAMLDEPETVYGGIAAAPLFRAVAQYALADLHVPPSREA